MDAAAPLAEADLPTPDPEADQPLLPRQIERLDRLADIGLQIAEALAAQAKGEGPKVVEGDLALAYDRVARAVRMAAMLQSRLTQDALKQPSGDSANRSEWRGSVARPPPGPA